MKKLVLLLFILLLVRPVSAEVVGCCCNEGINTDSDGIFPYTTQEICSSTWVGFGEQEPGQQFFNEFQDFCQEQCPNVEPIDPVAPAQRYSFSGRVVDVSDSNSGVANTEVFLNIVRSFGMAYSITDSNGEFSFQNIPEQNILQVIALNPSCSTAQEVFSLRQNINDAVIEVDCSIPSCPLDAIEVLEINPSGNGLVAELIPKTNQISDECTSLVEQVLVDVCAIRGSVQECRTIPYSNQLIDVFNEVSSLVDLEDLGFSNNGWIDNLQETTFGDDLSFRIGLKYPDGWAWSDFLGLNLGDPLCWTNNRMFCYYDYVQGDDAIVECDENLEIIAPQEENICSGNTYCATDSRGNVECKQKQPCDACNSVTSMFPDVFRVLTQEDNPRELSCTALVNDESFSACFRASSNTAQDFYESCASVTSCYDYTTKDSCQVTPCGTFGNERCEWVNSGPEVLGKGLCTPVGELRCEECTQAYGEGCSEDLCEGLGCAYTTFGDSPLCVPAERFACSGYTTRQECLGNTNGVEVDEWTNEILVPSNDTYNKGICIWAQDTDGTESCVRDADGNGEIDDCPGSFLDLTCEADNVPPITYLTLQAEESLTLQELTNIQVVVTDNSFSNTLLRTNFCLTTTANGCYPDTLLKNLRVDDDPGRYFLRYFSQDPANNLEVVRQIPINLIDTDLPEVIRVEVKP